MQGVIYYNKGLSCLVRLLVSLYSLRKVYQGDITILSEGPESAQICKIIADTLKVSFKEINSGIDEKHSQYLIKPYLNSYTPYELTLHIDSDTLIFRDPSILFEDIKLCDFIIPQFANWTTKGTGPIRRRIRRWSEIHPEYSEYSLKNKLPAINCGIYGWSNNSTIFEEWRSLLLQGKENFIPDEVSLQLLLPYYPHKIVSHNFNCSCKFDKLTDETYILHYHGRKHCRAGLPFQAKYWVDTFEEVRKQNLADVNKWYEVDRHITNLLKIKV